eukprot:290011-Prymnesium_polylepis.1
MLTTPDSAHAKRPHKSQDVEIRKGLYSTGVALMHLYRICRPSKIQNNSFDGCMQWHHATWHMMDPSDTVSRNRIRIYFGLILATA